MARKGDKAGTSGEILVCRNAKATQRYEIDEQLEAGLILSGPEVKSLRQRRADLEGSYASIEGNELVLHKMHIAPYEQAGPHFAHDPKRSRKLLVHRREVEKLHGQLSLRGYTLVPLRVYFKNGWAKVELGLAKSKNVGDRREEVRRTQDMKEARAAIERGRSR